MRLTQKNEYFEYILPEQNVMGDNQASEISLGETEYTCKKYVVGEAINKLGELEDVLEEFELTSAEDLRNHLNFQDNMAIWEGELNYKNKIAELEQELAELKQKAIVPKYQIKQHIWLARNNVFQKEPCELIVQNIEYNFKTEDFLYIIDFVEKGHHKSINMCDNGDLFATREEAEQKLTKIRGKE